MRDIIPARCVHDLAHAPHDRGRLARGVREDRRHRGAPDARRRPGRGMRAGRAGLGAGALAARRPARQPRRLAHPRPPKHRALDHLRHRQLAERKHEELGRDLEAMEALVVPDFVDGLDARRADTIGDDLLRLMFIACHPLLSTDARVALTLRLLGGLTTDEIARAFLVPEPTIAQRIVRAKKTLAAAQVPFELPSPQRAGRAPGLGDGGGVTWSSTKAIAPAPATNGCARRCATRRCAWRACWRGWRRPRPRRRRCRPCWNCRPAGCRRVCDAEGRPVLLPDQDRSLWSRPLMDSGLAALQRAEVLARRRAGPVPAAGRHRRLPCARRPGRRHRLAAHRGAVRHAGRG